MNHSLVHSIRHQDSMVVLFSLACPISLQDLKQEPELVKNRPHIAG